jgi:CheY-like chemotaxis protein
MAFKRALVVDDSKSARLALQQMLEAHDLIVEFAESGEEAIDFLKHQLVDVIFMDHTMPGMDGLETVTVIKSNPRTATIPVMMYTTKEGEVYVSQARALGAVGVLPKEVHPGALFQSLLDLGLVTDRRGESRDSTGPTPEDREDDDPDRAYERQAMGMSVQALVTRILEDQHLTLRADILRSHRDFARQVAEEIFRKQAEQEAAAAVPETTTVSPPPDRMASGLTMVLALCALVFGFLFAQIKDERDDLQSRLAEVTAASEAHVKAVRMQSGGLVRQREEALTDTQARLTQSLSTLEWAMNQNPGLPFDAIPFDDARALQLGELLTHLSSLGFLGTVAVESHLGEFCLTTDASGVYRLPDPSVSIDECTLFGHPLEDSSFPSDRQTPGFAAFLESSPFLQNPGIEVRLEARDRLDSDVPYGYPAAINTAGEWNTIAERNNRVVFRLMPADADPA